MSDAEVTPAVAAIRATLLAGLASVEDFGAATNRQPQTVRDWIRQGLPTQHVGNTAYVVVEPAVSWLRSRHSERVRVGVRGPGRPKRVRA